MSTTEINAQLKYRNTDGDTTVFYPITKADNITGVFQMTSGGTGASTTAAARTKLGIAPAFTYGTEDIIAGSSSNEADGTMRLVYATNDGVWDYVKKIFITIDGVWRLVCDTSNSGSGDDSGTVQTYTITANLSMVKASSSNPTTIAKNGTATLTFTANTGYTLPSTVSVTGATNKGWSVNNGTGTLTLSNPSGNVSITIIGVSKSTSTDAYAVYTDLTNATKTDGPSEISAGGTATLTFKANTGYSLPTSKSDISVTNIAATNWSVSNGVGTLELQGPTGNVVVTISAIEDYNIAVYPTNMQVYPGYTNPTTIAAKAAGGSATLYYQAKDGYVAPQYSQTNNDNITVTGATFIWSPSEDRTYGILGLNNATSNVDVVIKGIRNYSINTSSCENISLTSSTTTIPADGTATLTFKANTGYSLPTTKSDISATNTTVTNWSVSNGVGTLELQGATGDVTITMSAIKDYDITVSLTNMQELPSYTNPETIAKDGSATLYYQANDGYVVPDSCKTNNDYITVSGATFNWGTGSNGTLGVLELSDATSDVSVTIKAKVKTYSIDTTACTNVTVGGPAEIAYNGAATLTFTANTGYTLPSTISVSGVSDYDWVQSTGKLALNKPTGDVSVTVAGEKSSYSITTKLGTGLTAHSDNPTTISAGETATLKFTLANGYTVKTTSVTGATNSSSTSNGVVTLTLSNPTGNVTVNITSAALNKTTINYYLNTNSWPETSSTVYSTSGYATATNVTKSGATVTVTLSNATVSRTSYTYQSVIGSLSSVSFTNTSSGVIDVYATVT